MSYEKLNLTNGTVLTAAHLGHIEDGIATVDSAEESTAKVTDALALNNSWNRALVYGDFSTVTNRGVTFTWNSDHNVCTLNCTSSPTSDAVGRYLYSETSLCGLKPGGRYLFNVSRSKANTGVDLYFYINGTLGPRVGRFSSPTYVDVPSNATGILSRVYALAGAGVLTNATVSLEIIDSHSNAWLEEQLTARTPTAACWLTPSGDSTDRTSEIEAVLTASGTCNLAPGEYYVSNITMPDDTALKGSGSGDTKLIMITGETGAAVSLGTRCNVSDLSIYGQDTDAFTENANRHAIGWTGTFVSESTPGTYPVQGMASNLYIEGFKGAAIYCNATSMQTHSGIQVINVTAFECWSGVYIKKYSEFSQFTNFRANYCTYGCINNGGNNIFTNCNFSRSGTCLLMDDTDSQAPNNSHGSYVGCVFDHSGVNGSGYESNKGYSIILIGLDSGEMFTGCQIFYGRTKITDCVGIRFVGCNYGRRTNLEITDSTGVSFDDCVFRSNVDEDGTVLSSSGNIGLTFTNCLQYDGSVFDPNGTDTTVKYAAQSLTDAQKLQARTNIGAADAASVPTGVVRYDEAQTLTDAQKRQTQENIVVDPASAVRFVPSTSGYIRVENASTATSVAMENGEPVITASPESSTQKFRYSLIEVNEGDMYTIVAAGFGTASCGAYILAADGTILDRVYGTSPYQRLVWKMPSNAKWLYCAVNVAGSGYGRSNRFYTGGLDAYRIDDLESEVDTLQTAVAAITPVVETVSGATPSITAAANHRYVCTGTVTEISITPPASGLCEVTFTTGSSPVWNDQTGAVMPGWWPSTNPLESNTHYEMSFDGQYGVVMAWPT